MRVLCVCVCVLSDGVISHDEFRTGMGTLANLPSKDIQEIIDIVDKVGAAVL